MPKSGGSNRPVGRPGSFLFPPVHMLQSKHPQTNQFLNSPIFHDLGSFQELEARIEQLPTNQDKGDALEVFALAYLATQKQFQVQHIWSHQDVPLSIKQELHLPSQDMGIDGIYIDIQGHKSAYQVKFRSDRASLNWADELSTFMGLSDFAHQKVLFTNSDSIPTVMRDRRNFISICGHDLDRMDSSDFGRILQWLQGEQVGFVPKSPKPHQQEAIDDVIHGLQSEDRVTAVMPCGTGKTLVALWIAEKLQSGKVLVLVPSLALLRQTLHEWMKETRLDKISILSVCSDSTVKKGHDDWVIEKCDLDFPVTTDSQVVTNFLKQEIDATKIVFSTYQSSPVVAGGMGETDRFDLAVFDEAHKTAGRQGTKFSFALDDEKLPIKKRLFMTATPRHYNINKTNKAGDHQLFYSMDDGDKYGNLVHQLSFARSIEQEIICDYRVVISVVTSDEVNDKLLSQSDVLVGTDLVLARQVANQIALKRAVEKYQTGKIITFHGQVKSAKSFVSRGNEGVGYHLTDFSYWHINGKMNTSERASIMKEFRNANSSIISNARCLTEGVDVPAVDMVCFMSPKKSKVDIVQAVGRAMRTSDDKEFGYILIPLYLQREIGESIEGALARTDFSEVWNVINALKEQDEVLNDVISQMRTDKGRRKGFDDSRFRGKVEILGADLDLATLRRSITVELVDKLGASWDEMYGRLMTYKEEFSHDNVPNRYAGKPALGRWVSTQRAHKKEGELGSDRIEKLDEIGFTWDLHDGNWNQRYRELQEFHSVHGHCNVPRGYAGNPGLGRWVNRQREYKRTSFLESDRIEKLDNLGFSWYARQDMSDHIWNLKYQELIAYKEEFGDCNVPSRYAGKPALGRWVSTQRAHKKEGELGSDRIEKLDEIGFTWWDLHDDNWNQRYRELQEFHSVHGHCNVPRGYAENPGLGRWVNRQREYKRTSFLELDRIEQLEAIGFEWTRRKPTKPAEADQESLQLLLFD